MFGMPWVAVIFIFFYVVAIGARTCPNQCSGHGVCSYNGTVVCDCFASYTGLDCSQRLCPKALAWVGKPYSVDQAHVEMECSNRGHCDRQTGKCSCFAGYTGLACRESTCGVSNCNGHGYCITMDEAYRRFTYGQSTQSNFTNWEGDHVTLCSCELGYGGTDCSQRLCPKGDDPMTASNGTRSIRLHTTVSDSTRNKEFRFSFFEESFLFKPRQLTSSGCEAALMSLPNIAKVNCTHYEIDGYSDVFTIDFLSWPVLPHETNIYFHDGNPPLSYFGCDTSMAGDESAGVYCTLENLPNLGTLPEYSTCSNRGLCNFTSGVCNCFGGFSNSNCDTETDSIRLTQGYATNYTIFDLVNDDAEFNGDLVLLDQNSGDLSGTCNFFAYNSQLTKGNFFSAGCEGDVRMNYGGLELGLNASGYTGQTIANGGLYVASGGFTVAQSGFNITSFLDVVGNVGILASGLLVSGDANFTYGLSTSNGLTVTDNGINIYDGVQVSAGGMTVRLGGVWVNESIQVAGGGLNLPRRGMTILSHGMAISGGLYIQGAASSGLRVSQGLTVFSGGFVLNSGGLSVLDSGIFITGGLTVRNLGLIVDNGALTVQGAGVVITGGLSVNSNGVFATGGTTVRSNGLLINQGGLSITGGMTLFTQGLFITTLGLTVQSGGVSVNSGGMTVVSSGAYLQGGLYVQSSGFQLGSLTIRNGGLSVRTAGLQAAGGVVVNAGGATVNTQGFLISAGGLSVVSNGFQVTSGGFTIGSGGVYVQSGGLTVASNGALLSANGLTVYDQGISVVSGGLSVSTIGAQVTGGMTVITGGLQIVTGGLTLSNGGLVLSAGGLTTSSNGLEVQAGLTVVDVGMQITGGLTVSNGGLQYGGSALFRVTSDGLQVSVSGLTVQDVGLRVSADGLTVSNGLNVLASGLSLPSDGLVISDTGLTVTSGGFRVFNSLTGSSTLSASGGVTLAGGLVLQQSLTVTAGGLIVTGGVSVRSGGIVMPSLTVTSGAIRVTGGTTVQTNGLVINTGGLSVIAGGLRAGDTTIVSNIRGGAIVTGGLTVSNGDLIITTGGLSVVSGGVLFSSGGLTIAAGGLSVTSGGLTVGFGGLVSSNSLQILSGGAFATGGMTVGGQGFVSGQALTVTDGGISVVTGGLKVAAGGLTISGLNVNDLGFRLTGGCTINEGLEILVGGTDITGGGVRVSGSRDVTVNNLGVLILGTSPSTVYQNTNLDTNPYQVFSDRRLKRRIKTITQALHKVAQLEPVRYSFMQESKTYIGVLAQQVREVIPELVHTMELMDETGESMGEYLSVSYDSFLPILIEAVHELRALGDKEEHLLSSLENSVLALDQQAAAEEQTEILSNVVSVPCGCNITVYEQYEEVRQQFTILRRQKLVIEAVLGALHRDLNPTANPTAS